MDSFRLARIFGWIPASVCVFAASPVWAQSYAPVPAASTVPAVPAASAQNLSVNPASGTVPGSVTPSIPAAAPTTVPMAPAAAPSSAVPAASEVPTTADAPIVPHEDGSSERPMPAPFVLSAQEQAQTDAVLTRWEQFSTAIQTFETDFTRIMYKRSFDSAKLERTNERGELRYESPDHGMLAVTTMDGNPSEKWLCDGVSVFEYKFSQKQIDQYTLPPEMRGKGITQGPLPFLFGASVEELKRRYYLRQIQPTEDLARPGQIWIEAYPRTSDDASEFQHAVMIISFGNDVRPLAIKLFKANQEQHVYMFDLKSMKVNKTQLLPSTWVPTVPEKMRMKLIPVE